MARDHLHRELTRARELLSALTATSMEGVMVLRDGEVVLANEQSARILGFSLVELIGSRPARFVVDEWQPLVRERMIADDAVYSFLFRRKNGTTVPIRVHGHNETIDGVPHRIASFIDLSRESPVPFTDDWSERELYGAEAPVVWIHSDGRILYLNSVMRRTIGLGDDPLDDLKIWDVDIELTESGWQEMLRQFRKDGALEFRTRVIRSDGTTFPILVHARHRRLGNLEYISASFDDVTKEVAMKRSELRSRKRLGLALEAATMGLWEWNADRDRLSLSPELEEMVSVFGGLPSRGLRALLRTVERRDVRTVIDTVESAVGARSRFSFTCQLRPGLLSTEPRWIECWGDVQRDAETDETTLFGAAMDITDRRRRLKEIRLERERFRSFAEGSLDGFFLLEARVGNGGVVDFHPTYVNDVVGSMTGVSIERIVGNSMRENCPVSVRVGIADVISEAFATGETIEGEYGISRPSGGLLWARVQAVPYSKGVGVSVRDVTGRRRREAELAAYRQKLEDMVDARTAKLRRSEAEFRSVVENARDIMGIVDEDHRYVFVNDAARTSRDIEVVGRRAGLFVQEAHQKKFHDAIDEVFESRTDIRLEVPVDWRDGSVRWMDCRFSPVTGGDGVEAVTIVCRDVTEKRQAQQEIETLNRELEQRVDARTAEIRSLLDTSRRFAALQSETRIQETITESLLDLIPGARSIVVWSRDNPDDPFSLLAFDAPGAGSDGRPVLPGDADVPDRVRAAGGRLVIHRESDEESLVDGITGISDAEAAIITVVGDESGSELVVVAGVDESGAKAGGRTLRLVESVASQASVAIENARLFRQIRSVSLRLLHVQENERREVAHELHDQVGGHLTSLQFLMQQFEPADPGDDLNAVKEAREMVKSLMDDIRSLTLALRPALLDDFGFIPALEAVIKRHRKQGALDVDLEYDCDRSTRFDPDVETAAFRVVQEALTNVIRHAETDTATVLISVKEDTLDVEIIDSGRGFDVETALETGRSLGVRGMLERVELVEGSTSIESEPGRGTRIRFSLPIDLRSTRAA